MCGIFGLWHPDGRVADVDQVRAGMTAMRHRGPEGAGYARLDGDALLFGFLKLGFTDAPGGLQPLFNEDHTVALVYNGEVYDYEDLRAELIAKGHTFRTPSDSEVLIHLYEEHGEAFVDRLNGEFAFVLWDARKEQLLCVRDRFGVKPLLYARHRGGFVFASESKAILALDGFTADIDPRWFTGPGIGLAETSMTPFRGIDSVKPGQLMRVTRRGIEHRTWWRPDFTPFRGTRAEAVGAVRAEVERAVDRRVRGDVPIALALSSGLDSTIVAGLAAQRRSGLRAFSLHYPGARYDESATAERTASAYGLDFVGVACPTDTLADDFLASIWHTEIPTNSLSTVARMQLTKAVRASGDKALAGGEGSDELFGGYPFFGLEAIWRMAPGRAQDAALDRFRREEHLSKGGFWDERRRGSERMFGFPSVYAARAASMDHVARVLLTRSARDGLFGRTPSDSVRTEHDVAWLRTLAPFDVSRVLQRSVVSSFAIPALGDRVEMAHSLEGRAPFLDKHVLALACAMPQEWCVDVVGNVRKVILRDAFRDQLPAGWSGLPKHMWMAPTFAELARTEVGRGLFDDLLAPARVRDVGLLRPAAVAALRAAWRIVPRGSLRFDAIDGLVGYALSVQALHDVFVGRSGRFLRGPTLQLTDLTPARVPA